MQVELKSDIPEDGKHIMPKRVGCTRILIDGAWFLSSFINLNNLLHIKLCVIAGL
jgi:hypothetical protein